MVQWLAVFLISVAFSEVDKKAQEQLQEQSAREVRRESINLLKDEVLNKKTQSLLLRQLIKSEGIESTFPKVTINHFNEMGSRYQIVSLIYSLDDQRIYTYYQEDASTGQSLGKSLDIFKGPMIPGKHNLTVEVVYRGNDTGVFSYINDYKVPAKGSVAFQVEKGQNLEIQVKGFEKGWALTDFKDRPDLAFKLNSPNNTN